MHARWGAREQAKHRIDPETWTRNMQMSNVILDAKGLNCPLPVLKAKKALQGMSAGGLLEIYATDPGAVKDFQAFCRSTGNELVASSLDGNVYKFVIKRVK
jgi:tRNA 2-thiouridine synthesizing protein A